MAKIIRCKTCSNHVSEHAKTCPHCGEKQTRPFGCGFLLIPTILVAWIISINNSHDPGSANNGSTESSPGVTANSGARPHQEKLDLSRAIYTRSISDTYGAMVCPSEIFYDQRVDKGLEAAFKAKQSIFGHKEKVKSVGCEELKGGIRLHFDLDELKRISDLKSAGSEGFVYFKLSPDVQLREVIFTGDLTNNPSGKYGESPTGESD